ncbi:zinc finger and BTB domain-containing protein 49-like isoform X2 [Centruroides sculpturatus]|nr:zinc finger and BTB domain-containing protein 49-like isoform X2 [Centruroides sculpturatus]
MSRIHQQTISFESKESKMKIYPCNNCNETFGSPSSLKLHMRSHNGEQPFLCSICRKAFSNKSNLTRHKKKFHPELENELFCGEEEIHEQIVVDENNNEHAGSLCKTTYSNEILSTNVQDTEINEEMQLEENDSNLKNIHKSVFDMDLSFIMEELEPSFELEIFPEIQNINNDIKCIWCNEEFQNEVSLREHVEKSH